jgi:hypothetical protein
VHTELTTRRCSATDVYRVCERMAAIDLGIATSVLTMFAFGLRPRSVLQVRSPRAPWPAARHAGRARARPGDRRLDVGSLLPEVYPDLGARVTLTPAAAPV